MPDEEFEYPEIYRFTTLTKISILLEGQPKRRFKIIGKMIPKN